ncbi:MAG: hypothetical protein EXR72_09785 [Myxococcales bacterium]|nr:hypothetical protein [Myxococcales bacterium]
MKRTLLLLALAALIASPASGKKKKKRRAPPQKALVKPQGSPALILESLDLATAQAVVLVAGVAHAPDARLFTFHDQRDRHFIALAARCEPAGRAIRCVLDLPKPYLAAPLQGFTLKLRRGEIVAPPDQVASLFAAAQQAAATAPPRPPDPRMPLRPHHAPPDGGMPPQSDDEQEGEESEAMD